MPSPLSAPDVWNAVAPGYTGELVPLFSRYAEDALQLADLAPDARVLDVAAGPGTLALLAAPRVAHVTAVDFAETMVATLERRAIEAGVTNVEALQADGQALPFADERFDGVFSMFGLIFFPDRATGFREAHRVLKPGGRAVVSSWTPLDGIPLLRACFGALGNLLPQLPFGDGKAPLGDPDEVRAEMAAAGFRAVEVHTVTHRAEAASVAAFWESNVRSSAPLVLIRSRFDAAAWAEIGAGVVARLEEEFGTGPVEIAWPALLGVGVKERRADHRPQTAGRP